MGMFGGQLNLTDQQKEQIKTILAAAREDAQKAAEGRPRCRSSRTRWRRSTRPS